MALSGKIFADRHAKPFAALVLVLVAFSAVAAREHRAYDRSGPVHRVEVDTNDYLAWHYQQAASVEVDSLSGSLHLFSTIADKLAADAGEGEGYTSVAVHGASQHAVER